MKDDDSCYWCGAVACYERFACFVVSLFACLIARPVGRVLIRNLVNFFFFFLSFFCLFGVIDMYIFSFFLFSYFLILFYFLVYSYFLSFLFFIIYFIFSFFLFSVFSHYSYLLSFLFFSILCIRMKVSLLCSFYLFILFVSISLVIYLTIL